MSEACDDAVKVRFEACTAFEADGSGTAACAACGWLDHEHEGEAPEPEADVRVLPARPAQPARLAS